MGLFGPSSLEERIMQIIEKQEKILRRKKPQSFTGCTKSQCIT